MSLDFAAAQVELDAVVATLKEKQDNLATVGAKVGFFPIIYFLSFMI